MTTRTTTRVGALAVAIALAAGACGGDGDGSGTDDGIEVSDAWARSSPAGVNEGAAYMTIESAADDELVGASVPTDVAATAQLHETVVGGADAGTTDAPGTSATDGAGAAMTMRHVSAVVLPSGETVAFEPGGLHVMLTELAEPLVSGSSFDLTLTFARAEPQTVTVEIRDEAP